MNELNNKKFLKTYGNVDYIKFLMAVMEARGLHSISSSEYKVAIAEYGKTLCLNAGGGSYCSENWYLNNGWREMSLEEFLKGGEKIIQLNSGIRARITGKKIEIIDSQNKIIATTDFETVNKVVDASSRKIPYIQTYDDLTYTDFLILRAEKMGFDNFKANAIRRTIADGEIKNVCLSFSDYIGYADKAFFDNHSDYKEITIGEFLNLKASESIMIDGKMVQFDNNKNMVVVGCRRFEIEKIKELAAAGN